MSTLGDEEETEREKNQLDYYFFFGQEPIGYFSNIIFFWSITNRIFLK